MKILHVIPSMSASYGGPSHALTHFQKILTEQNIESTIVATEDAADGPLISPSSSLLLFKRQFPKAYFYSIPMRKWLEQHIQNYDIVHIHSFFSYPSMIAGHYARLWRKPYLIRPFGTLDKYCMKRHFFRKKIYLELFEKKNLNAANFIHCTSLSEKEYVESFRLTTKCFVSPLGVLIDQNSCVSKEILSSARVQKKTILFLSRIDPKKGLELLLRAAKYLKAKHSNFNILVAGTGVPSYVAKVKARAIAEGVDGLVSFIGEVTGKDKEEVFQSADVFVLPSYRENFGLAVVEAMQFGCPVVVSDQVAIQTEIAEYGAGLVVPLDPLRLSQALEELLNSEAKRVQMGRRGKVLAIEKFDFRKNSGFLVLVYKNLLSKKSEAPC